MVWDWIRLYVPEGVPLIEASRIPTKETSRAACTTAAGSAGPCEHEVQRGDWLYDICRMHNVDLRSMMVANPTLKNPNSLIVGSRIKIPSGHCVSSLPQFSHPAELPVSVQSSRREGTVMSKSFLKTLSCLSSGFEIFSLRKVVVRLGRFLKKGERRYKVVEGDSLEWLAEKFGTSTKSIKKLNNLKDDIICTGSVLKIERSEAFEEQTLVGRKASAQERAASNEGYRVGSLVKTFMSTNPLFSTRLQKSRKPKALASQMVKVQYGDTLADIASAHGLTIRELQRLNHLQDDVIFEGDVLAVNSGQCRIQLIDVRGGCRRTNQPLFSRQTCGGLGAGGPQSAPSIKSVIGRMRSEGRWKRKKKGFQVQEKWMRFKSPITVGFISSPYGWRWGSFHEGVDLAADQGTPILASDRGTVTFAGWNGGYGYLIAIQHEGGFVTRYAHCCAIHACVGQRVSRGQLVASVGSTGHATGPHLHFEVRKDGEALDPFKWVDL